MSPNNPIALARELAAAYSSRQLVALRPSSRDSAFDLPTAYAVEAELVRLRQADGHRPVGRKVGFANKALWRALKLDTVVWAHMYDDTVRYAADGDTTLAIGRMYAPKIEPEIVFKLKRAVDADALDAAAVLGAVEWLALGFEIIDCVFADWKFQPTDFVASFGLHAALVVGQPLHVEPAAIPALAEELARFTVKLRREGTVVEEGAGRNCLRSPALSLGELAAALSRQPGADLLAAGELVSSGTLTESRRIAENETWTAVVDGLGVPELTVHVIAD
jgi:2-oxo-3-hexenedioate decarboxylase